MAILDLYQYKPQGKLAADPVTEFIPSDFKSNTRWQHGCVPCWGYYIKQPITDPQYSKMKHKYLFQESQTLIFKLLPSEPDHDEVFLTIYGPRKIQKMKH